MDKDMMDKVNEAMKANGMRELSLDEMDKVSGGNMWEEMGYVEFDNFWMGMTRTFGYDVAINMFKDATGYVTYSSGTGTAPGGGSAFGDRNSDEDKMGIVLTNFWNCIEQGANGYH